MNHTLADAQQRHDESPETFHIPSDADLRAIEPGSHVKLIFEAADGPGERMWVRVTEIDGEQYVGSLDNDPFIMTHLGRGDTIHFERRHIASTL